MPPELPGADLLQYLSLDTPTLLRVLLGLVGIFVMVRGAAVYEAALRATAFGMGAVGTLSLLYALHHWLGITVYPEVVLIAGLVGGAVMMIMAVFAHTVTLIGVGAVAGLLLGSGISEAVFGDLRIWLLVVGPGIGSLLFPLLYQQLLKVFTPLGGGILVASAAGFPGNIYLICALWLIGATIQLFGGSSDDDDDE